MLGGRGDWPSVQEFDTAGLHAFREALRHHGGPARWSREMGVSWSPPAGGSAAGEGSSAATRQGASTRQGAADVRSAWPKWTEESVEAALVRFLDGRRDWPRYREFVYAGHKGLYQAVLKHGGSRAWAQRTGVAWVDRRGTETA